MTVQTTVKNASVTESDDKTIVTNNSVAESEKKAIENKVRENLRSEYSREAEELKVKIEENQSKIEELEEEINLTKSQKAELEKLNKRNDTLEDQISELDTNEKYRPYVEKINRVAAKTKEESKKEAVEEAVFQVSARQAESALKKAASAENIKVDDFRKEINSIIKELGGLENNYPDERLEIALTKRQERKLFSNRELELKKREEALQILESGQTQIRDENLNQIIDSGDTIAWAKKIGL